MAVASVQSSAPCSHMQLFGWPWAAARGSDDVSPALVVSDDGSRLPFRSLVLQELQQAAQTIAMWDDVLAMASPSKRQQVDTGSCCWDFLSHARPLATSSLCEDSDTDDGDDVCSIASEISLISLSGWAQLVDLEATTGTCGQEGHAVPASADDFSFWHTDELGSPCSSSQASLHEQQLCTADAASKRSAAPLALAAGAKKLASHAKAVAPAWSVASAQACCVQV